MANRITWSTLGKGGEYIYGYKSSRDYTVSPFYVAMVMSMLASGLAKRYNKGGDYNILAHFADEVDPAFPGAVMAMILVTRNSIVLDCSELLSAPAGMSLKKSWTSGIRPCLRRQSSRHSGVSAKTGNLVKAYETTAETKKALMDTPNYFKKFRDVF